MCGPNTSVGDKTSINLTFYIAELYILTVIGVFIYILVFGTMGYTWVVETPVPGKLTPLDVPWIKKWASPAQYPEHYYYGLSHLFLLTGLLSPFFLILPVAFNLIAYKSPAAFAIDAFAIFILGAVYSGARAFIYLLIWGSPAQFALARSMDENSGTAIPWAFYVVFFGETAYLFLAIVGMIIEFAVVRTGQYVSNMEYAAGIKNA